MSEVFDGFGTDYETARASTGGGKPDGLLPGGYVLRIIGAKMNQTRSGKKKLDLAFDICEGIADGYYRQLHDYQLQFDKDAKWKGVFTLWWPDKNGDKELYERNLSAFKAAVTAINDSNQQPIDVQHKFTSDDFRGKLVGGVFGEVEWEFNGSYGWRTECRWLRSVDAIRSEQFGGIPKRKPHPSHQNATPPANAALGDISEFAEILSDSDIPF